MRKKNSTQKISCKKNGVKRKARKKTAQKTSCKIVEQLGIMGIIGYMMPEYDIVYEYNIV